jgi:hypothetical protein
MTYIIASEIGGFTYYVNILNINELYPTGQFRFEGMRNNATEFKTEAEAQDALVWIKTEHHLDVIPKK